VNFLLHHAFARSETGSDVSALGAMLPDLWRMAHPRVRARAGVSVRDERPATRELSRGVEHHLTIDAWFHGCAVFTDGERELGEQLRGLGVPKLGMLAHAAWELCLDGAWVRRNDPTRALLVARSEAGDAVRSVADGHGAERLDDAAQVLFHARMEALFEGLLEGPWVRSYATPPGLVALVEGMRTRRLGLAPMSAEARSELACVFERIEARADESLEGLFEARASAR
jgi:hypothetical protein